MKRHLVSAAVAALLGLGMHGAFAQPAPQGGSLPLAEVLVLAKPYPNLMQEVRLELLRAGVRKEAVVCSGRRLSAEWPALTGARTAPYECRIGRRKLVVTARQTFYDANGHRLSSEDPQVRRRAVKVAETGLQWRWR